nr:MAG TPA: hypothetical protein [Caudoviricetes sp.]
MVFFLWFDKRIIVDQHRCFLGLYSGVRDIAPSSRDIVIYTYTRIHVINP